VKHILVALREYRTFSENFKIKIGGLEKENLPIYKINDPNTCSDENLGLRGRSSKTENN